MNNTERIDISGLSWCRWGYHTPIIPQRCVIYLWLHTLWLCNHRLYNLGLSLLERGSCLIRRDWRATPRGGGAGGRVELNIPNHPNTPPLGAPDHPNTPPCGPCGHAAPAKRPKPWPGWDQRKPHHPSPADPLSP